MLQLLAKIRELLSGTGLSISSLIAVLKLLVNLGLPPALTDKIGFRDWVKKVAETIASVAAMTTSLVDDQLAALILKIASNDTAWDIFYSILEKLQPSEDGIFKAAMSDEDFDFALQSVADALAEDGDEMSLSPAVILAAFKIISTLWSLFRS